MSSSSSKSSQARLREALTAGGPSTKDKGPPVADGALSVTPDTAEAIEWRSRQSVVDRIAACSHFLDCDDDGERRRALRGAACCWVLLLPACIAAQSAAAAASTDANASPLRPAGPQTNELYGKFTWRLDRFGDGGKRELRSNVFEVGSFKWCASPVVAALVAELVRRSSPWAAAAAGALPSLELLLAAPLLAAALRAALNSALLPMLQVPAGLPARLRCGQPPLALPVCCRLRQAAAGVVALCTGLYLVLLLLPLGHLVPGPCAVPAGTLLAECLLGASAAAALLLVGLRAATAAPGASPSAPHRHPHSPSFCSRPCTVYDCGGEPGPQEVQVLGHPAPLLQEGARLGLEEVHGAVQGRQLHPGGAAGRHAGLGGKGGRLRAAW